MADLEELAGRVEGLQGPDREVDAEIALAAKFPDWCERTYPGWVNSAQSSWAALNYDAGGNGFPIPAYTASIDDAMTLVPDGWALSLAAGADGAHALLVDDRVYPIRSPDAEASAGTIPLALTAAALRALSRTQGNQNGR